MLFSQAQWSDLSLYERILASLFQSVTLRTAGFNSVDLTLFTEAGIKIMLMYVVLFLTGGIIISCIEDIPILTCFFETAFAIGTVDLTLVFAAVSGKRVEAGRFPEEKITVG